MGHTNEDRLEQHPGYAVKRLQLAVRVATDAAIAPTELSMAQFAVLRVLADAGPVTAAELARRCFITRQSIRDVLANLETRGLAARTGGGDRPARLITITGPGSALLDRAIEKVDGVDRRMLDGLSPRQQIQFVAWLNVCADNLTGPPVHVPPDQRPGHQ